MRPVRVAAATVLFGALLPLGGATPVACAAEGPHAVLVVDTESAGGQHSLCIALPDGSVTGIELIELANEQHGLQYRLGYGGNVVCQLAGVGYDSDECLRSGPEFWGYWRGDGSGGWDWSSTGGHATTVTDGDVEGWSWGTGNDGSSHPAPPNTTFASVCGAPAGSDGPSGGGKKDEGQKPGSGSGGSEQGAKGTDASASIPAIAAQEEVGASLGKSKKAEVGSDRRKERRAGSQESTKATEETPSGSVGVVPSPSVSPTPNDTPTSLTDEGIPVGGVVASVAMGGCLIGAVFLQRRRSRSR